MAHYFVSDIHLSADQPELSALFFSFLREHGAQMHSLVILGDLFDAWIGDDDDQELPHELAVRLSTLRAAGSQIALMHGNRDFLIGKTYADQCGAQLLPELVRASAVQGISALPIALALCHGDHLCSQDLAYQQFRAQVRQPAWQQAFLQQSLAARREFGARARAQSKQHQAGMAAQIADVEPQAVSDCFAQSGARYLLHGHTHRPAVHQLGQYTRVVLGDWRPGQPSWLRLEDGQAELVAHGGSRRFQMECSQ